MTAETTTKNYGWTKPVISGSPSTWGGFLNTDLDSIDALVFANQQGLSPIGAITMFGGATPPANWLLCNGQSLDKTTLVGGVAIYQPLFAVLTNNGANYVYGGSGNNFNLPNLVSKFPCGANGSTGLGTVAGEATHTLLTGEMPVHTHTATEAAHTHTATQPAHNHADSGHGHGVNDPTHFHTGVFRQTGSPTAGLPGTSVGTGSQTDAAATGISIQTGYANLAAAQPAITVSSTTPTITVANAGSGTPHNNMPPYVQLNFIIRYQ